MKKTLAMLLALMLLLSACSQSEKPSSDVPANTIDLGGFDIDFDFSMPSIEPIGSIPNHVIDIDLSGIDWSISVEPIDISNISKNVIQFEPDFDFELSVEPVRVSSSIIEFDFPDIDISIDTESFDVETFVQDSVENFTEEEQKVLEKLEVQKIVTIAETRANLLADLSYAFQTSGLAVTVDEELGEIMLDSSVLFDVNKSEISEEGKEFLRKFLVVYTTVVFNPKYDGFLSKVLVEGHTDSDGDYNYNMTLSQNRANSVLEFCLSEETGASEADIAALEKSLEAVGYSSDKLIYDENGKEDKAASRRVSFRFLISLS